MSGALKSFKIGELALRGSSFEVYKLSSGSLVIGNSGVLWTLAGFLVDKTLPESHAVKVQTQEMIICSLFPSKKKGGRL